jgi:hypothetical protein
MGQTPFDFQLPRFGCEPVDLFSALQTLNTPSSQTGTFLEQHRLRLEFLKCSRCCQFGSLLPKLL